MAPSKQAGATGLALAWPTQAEEGGMDAPTRAVLRKDPLVLIRGAGDLASGVAHRLCRAHLRVVMTEAAEPLAVRRTVSFCEAVYHGRQSVEGVEAVRAGAPEDLPGIWENRGVGLLVDPELTCLAWLKPDVLVEATIAKRNLGLRKDMAPLVIALGPGFEAGVDAHLVVETKRGHDLGRIYERGFAIPNTGVPGVVMGVGAARVLRAPADGVFEAAVQLGDLVEQDQVVGWVAGQPALAGTGGLVRGLIRPGTRVHRGLKIGDVDPRGEIGYLNTISDKARALGGAVLEAVLRAYNHPQAV